MPKGRVKRRQIEDFSVVAGYRSRGNGYKMKHRKFSVKIRKHLFSGRVAEHWHTDCPKRLWVLPSCGPSGDGPGQLFNL